MTKHCMVCKTVLGESQSYINDVFDKKESFDDKLSHTTLVAVLQDILNEKFDDKAIHSKALCMKCCDSCKTYESYKKKITDIKQEMNEKFKSLPNLTLKSPTKVSPVKMNKIVVPASRLLPVPADFQLNIGQLSQVVSRASMLGKSQQPSFSFKVSVGSTDQQKTPSVKVDTVESSNKIPSKTNIAEWNTSMVPKEIFSNSDESNQIKVNYKIECGDADQTRDGESSHTDGPKMEIDVDCSMAVVPVNIDSQKEMINIKTESSQSSDYSDLLTLANGVKSEGNIVLSNFKIFNENNSGDEDGEEHTIVVNSDNASILEMMSGQKVIYENGGISLVMADDGDEHNQDNDNDDGDDSNDESQIELQVSGDEETANAIIAAAQEEGGAFIKVESGKMYRVKSVASKSDPESQFLSNNLDGVVIKKKGKYSCSLCQATDDNETDNLDPDEMMHHLKIKHDITIMFPNKHRISTENGVNKTQGEPTKYSSKKRIHECSVCHKSYNSRTLLMEHLNKHTGAKPHVCNICNKGFASKYTHFGHMKTHEKRPRPFECSQCNKSFLTIHNLKQHEKTHLGIKEYVCNICNKAFATQHNLDVHGVVHTQERSFVCSYCGKGFHRKAELVDHQRTHTGERPFACDTCGARFAQRSNLYSHRRATHLDDKRYKCHECPKRFKRRRLLDYHIKATHTGERPLKCEVCPATFVYPEHYKKHAKIHTGVRPYVCEICGKTFSSRDNRNMHRFTHSDKKPYECLTCRQSYMRKCALIQHMNDSGHFAESIVVNQPRVTSVQKDGTEIATFVPDSTRNSIGNVDSAIFHTSGKVESIGKTAHSVIADENGKYYIETVAGTIEEETGDNILLEAVSASQLDDATQLATDEKGAVLRLIQVKLPNGTDGWVALD